MTLSLKQMKANRRKWVRALRSGKYRQTHGYLYAAGGYCCLGVLACVAGKPSAELYDEQVLKRFKDVMDFVGLDDPSGTFIKGDDEGEIVYGELADLNDNGKTFAELADIIESEPPGLFVTEAA